MGERLKELRRALKITQAEFGQRIGVTGAWVSRVEINERNITGQMVVSICRVYNVNEGWLRTGEGEMFLSEPKALLDALDCEDSLTQKDKAMLAGFLCLSPKDREGVANYVLKAADLFKGDRVRVPLTAADRAAMLDREEAAALDRVRAEFARKRQEEQGAP